MRSLREFLKLSDPQPGWEDEFFCYIKTILGTILILLGLFLFFNYNPLYSPLGILGIIFFFLGIFLFGRIKLVQMIFEKGNQKIE